ncbi:glycosyltransferase family 39 protein [Variovorax sp. KK3]|uniref:ArnT family glycosyltransferase n=1 Tax=Variovorax sp. KK3 TaxID=1855728 RepID=UPI0021179A89|nr:glycosyltransferase family 39 protein [Variovorax sp. KK3]
MAIFAAACWGFGRALFLRLGSPVRGDFWLETAMATALGIGIFICVFQVLGIAKLLNMPAVLMVVAVGFAAACIQLPGWVRQARALVPGPRLSWLEKVALAALALVALPTLFEPLAPPAAFDELMYHLPYARLVAQSGSLGIHEWLRYPWFPYNYNLLYAAALLVGDDVLPHFLSALAGWLAMWMVYRLGLAYLNRVLACAAAAVWLGIGDYASALIDMGVALFVLSAWIALWWWNEAHEQHRAHGVRWLALSAFFLGLAAGSKYQALTFLPLVAWFVVRRERRPAVWGVAMLCFLLPCIYWFARNAITTGDPFNPIGAKVFGFTNWNLADYKNQLDDVRAHAALPNFLIWPVVLAPFSRAWRRVPAVHAAIVFCAYSLIVWAATSRYPRYMTAAFPLLALVAVLGWQVLLGWIAAGLRKVLPALRRAHWPARAGAVAAGLLLAVLVVVSWRHTTREIANIATTPSERETFLRANVPGYAVMNHLREHATGRVYQIALSEAIYYGPNPIYGDTLGPWRYPDFPLLPAAEAARRFAGLGFEAVVMPDAVAKALSADAGFRRHFVPMIEQDGARAYRILPDAP